MRLRSLSYRIKIPLALTAVIVMTEVVVTAALMSGSFADARQDLETSARNLASVLARSVRDPVLRDDLWQTFEVIRTPLAVKAEDNPLQNIVVLDANQEVLVGTDPARFPVAGPWETLPLGFKRLVTKGESIADTRFGFPLSGSDASVVAAAPVQAEDGSYLGAVLLEYDRELFYERLQASLGRLALISVPGLLILIPLGWWWGKRIAEPLAKLAKALQRVGRERPAQISEGLPVGGRDEIGALSDSARSMLADLGRKEAMEREMVRSERLAAVGRVSTAIAHEINNPLGGMLNALDTLSTHGNPDPFTRRTVSLVERGLNQIKATVGALLVEARLDSPALTLTDWDDLRTLVQPEASSKSVELNWRVDMPDVLALPAHQVRQLVLNLLLNAVKASRPGTRVEMVARRVHDQLLIEVSNTGEPLSPAAVDHLFEPFVTSTVRDGKRRHGIGLWVCYQIAKQLKGTISADSSAAVTRFRVALPLHSSPTSMPEPILAGET